MQKLVSLFLIILFVNYSYSQEKTTQNSQFNLKTSTGVIFSDKEYLPHYLVFNRWGAVEDEGSMFLEIKGKYNQEIGKNWNFSSGVDLRNDNLIELFGQVDFKDWSFIGGKKKLIYGDINTDISSGSVGMSQNALPIPMLELRLNEYKAVPFTKGYLKVKGNLSQRWLEEDRYIAKARLHGKSLYGIADFDEEIGLQIGSSIIHFAQYGGTSPQGDKQPSSFEDYLRVFFGKGIPNPDGTSEGESNGLGNHLGLTELWFDKKLGDHRLRLNFQKQFEDKGSMQYISFKDYLLSVQWTLPEKNLLRSIRVELISSEHQSGEGLPDPTEEYPDRESNMGYDFGERDDYYNNYLYRSGWTYKGNVVGSPLFTTYKRTLNYLSPYPRYEVSISNNRVTGFHIGIEGETSDIFDYRLLFTHTRNYGSYAGLYEGRFNWGGIAEDPEFEYVFKDGLNQNYTLIELNINEPFDRIPLNFKVMMAYDFGELYNNFGSEISINYKFSKVKK